ncbi:hypothetical protein QYE76_063167 [Lolium multiflorum]|uniref:Uncharacterized protein n=1 Tax=Lolium multiflorum TaxID=4521 RepID=A0AAD8W927_LOLMU|nr:hypothetical protein QYE76_063167 [Lolium multiflorum]
MGPAGQKPGPTRGRTAKADGRGVRDDPNPAQILDEFAWPRTRKAGRSRPPLVRPWPACLQNTSPSHTSPHRSAATHGPAIWERVDAGHRRRDAGKRGGSIGRGPTLLSPRRSRVGGRRRRRCCPLTIATPPAVRSCAVSAGGELSCTVFPDRKSAETAMPAGPYGSIWIASACEVFVQMLELKCVPFQIMVDSDDEYYFKNFIDTSSEEESDDDFFTDAAMLIHEHIVSQIPVPLFRRIMDGVKIYDDYFCAKVDAIGKVGLSSYQKCTAAIRMLAYGVAGDFVDEYTRMSESTGLESMYRFCRVVIGSFGEQYLRQPNAEDTARLLSINASRGFPGMLAACMHWEWKNCPFGWRGHTAAILRGAQSFLKLLLPMTHGFGTHS